MILPGGAGPAALSATGLRLAHGDRTVVGGEPGADVSLAAGEVTALVGPNGSGKSTLLRALARLHAPAAGRVLVGDDDAFAAAPRDFARRVALLTQAHPTPSGVRVRDVVGYGRHPHRGRFGGGDPDGPAAVERAMALTGVAAMAERPADALSGGELQRVWLATCLAQGTGVVLLDEPTTYLDLRFQVEVLDLVRELAEDHGTAVGVVLHDLDQAAAVADHVVLLAAGAVLASGPPGDVLRPDLLTQAYGVRVDVHVDDAGRLRTTARGRRAARAAAPA